MTTKGSFYKQIIILMGTNNAERVMAQANNHVENINRLLRGIKSEISANYICSNNKEIVITTNKVAASFNLNIVKKYMKDLNDVDSNDITSPRLLQLKNPISKS